MTFRAKLKAMNACDSAVEWVGDRTLEHAWAECPRGDWMLWLAGELGVDRKLLVSAACACARTALQYVPAGEGRPLLAIEAAEAWCRGEATMDAVRAAASAASAAYAASDSAYAAADAAAYAASSAAADSAYNAAHAAHAASDSAAAYAAAARAQHAEIVRGLIQLDVIHELMK